MSKTIIVRIKSVYGENKVYPVCREAETFAKIAGTTTLTMVTIKLIKDLGYTVSVQSEAIKSL